VPALHLLWADPPANLGAVIPHQHAQLGVGISEFIIRYAAANVHAVVITVLGTAPGLTTGPAGGVTRPGIGGMSGVLGEGMVSMAARGRGTHR
jgi:hypothetical protein